MKYSLKKALMYTKNKVKVIFKILISFDSQKIFLSENIGQKFMLAGRTLSALNLGYQHN